MEIYVHVKQVIVEAIVVVIAIVLVIMLVIVFVIKFATVNMLAEMNSTNEKKEVKL